jgi:septin 7
METTAHSSGPIINENKNIVRRKLTGYVGFANLPNQWHRKSVRKGFNFNVMVVGMSPILPSFLVWAYADTSQVNRVWASLHL